MKSNKERAGALLNSIWDVSRVLVAGLQPMDPRSQSTAASLLKRRFAEVSKVRRTFHLYGEALYPSRVLDETCRILEEWTSKGFVKRLWSHGDFSDLADGMESRINAFRDTFSVSGMFELEFIKLMLNTLFHTGLASDRTFAGPGCHGCKAVRCSRLHNMFSQHPTDKYLLMNNKNSSVKKSAPG
jgi:hypothetical protein